jgi:transposase
VRNNAASLPRSSTYFECDLSAAEENKRRHGYSRHGRADCVQVVIVLVMTAEGLPLAYARPPVWQPEGAAGPSR